MKERILRAQAAQLTILEVLPATALEVYQKTDLSMSTVRNHLKSLVARGLADEDYRGQVKSRTGRKIGPLPTLYRASGKVYQTKQEEKDFGLASDNTAAAGLLAKCFFGGSAG